MGGILCSKDCRQLIMISDGMKLSFFTSFSTLFCLAWFFDCRIRTCMNKFRTFLGQMPNVGLKMVMIRPKMFWMCSGCCPQVVWAISAPTFLAGNG